MIADPAFDALKNLSERDRAFAELRAVAGGRLSRQALIGMARVAFPGLGAGAWAPAGVADGVQGLVARGILRQAGEVAQEWREPLTLSLLARRDSREILRTIRAAAPRSPREDGRYYWAGDLASDEDLARAVRLAALANDETEVERLIARAMSTEANLSEPAVSELLLRGCPAQPVFLWGLSPGLRDRVAAAHVERLLDGAEGDWADGLQALIQGPGEDGWDWALAPRLDRAMLRLDILAERPVQAQQRLPRLRALDPVVAMSAEAALLFLGGDTAGSLAGFREALKLHRRRMGRRKVRLPRELGLYHLMALFAASDPALHPEISAQLEVLADAQPGLAEILRAWMEVLAGRDDLARRRLQTQLASRMPLWDFDRAREAPLSRALVTLGIGVVDLAFAAERQAGDRDAFERWRRHAPLAARIIARTQARAASDPERWRGGLEALGEGYPRDFLQILPIRPAWERALDKLQAVLAPAAAPKPAPAPRTRRLVFHVDADSLEITALEQSAKRSGWSPGRPVALKRLVDRDPRLDYLGEEDQAPIRAIRATGAYYGPAYEFHPRRGLLALVGHPRVFDAARPEQAVELVAYPVELVVREEGEQIRIALSHWLEEPGVALEPESPSRWRVIEVTPRLVELAGILGPQGLIAPAAARARVVSLISDQGLALPVRAEISGVASSAVSGDPRPVLQIAPDGAGFRVRAVVRPLGDGGPACAPGVGASSVLAPAGHGHQRVMRDLQAEASALEAVLAACPSLEPWRESDHAWRLGGIDEALAALQELHAFQGALGLEWPDGAAIRPTPALPPSALSLNITSRRDWFELKGELRIDEDLVLGMEDVLAGLASSHGRFVPLDDGRYLVLTDELRRRLEALAALTEETKGARRVGAAAVAALGELVEGVGAVQADGRWTALVARIAEVQGHDPQPPAGLEAELRDYQLQGFRWLARLSRLGLGACLADDMGLGKTVQTLALLISEAEKGPSLVVAPTSVCHNWALEAARFAPGLRVALLAAAADRQALVASLGPGDLLVVSYGLLHTESELLASRAFAVAVFDEAQNLKNAETRRAKASKLIQASFRLALSGTPVENRLDELWSLFDTVAPGLLGSREGFQRRFSGPIEKGQPAARQALRSLLRPYLLRRTKAAVLEELPSRTEITLEIEPGPQERAFYEALRRRALEALSGDQPPGGPKRLRILAEITRLRRAACHPALIDPALTIGSAKLAAFLRLVADLRANRHRALVFSQFTSHLDLVEAALQPEGCSYVRLDGATPARVRAQRVEAFQSGQAELFLISLKAGGSGLNLTAADYVIHLDPWWNPAVEDQATDRAHRIGQVRPVTVYRLMLAGSIEESILSLHAAKRALAADFLDGADGAAKLGEDELMALIRGQG